MDTLQQSDGGPSSASPIREFFLAPLQAQTYRNLLFLLLQFPLGIAYFTTLVTLGAMGIAGIAAAFSAGQVIVSETASAGVPLFGALLGFGVLALVVVVLVAVGLVGATVGGVGIYTVDRLISSAVVGKELPRVSVSGSIADDPVEFLKTFFLAPGTYISTLAVLAKFPLGIAVFVVLTVPIVIATTFIVAPLLVISSWTGPSVSIPRVFEFAPVGGVYTVTSELITPSGAWMVDTIPEALLLAGVGVGLLLVTVYALNALAWLAFEATVVLSRHASVFSLGDA
jgi:hypothetical protein